MKQLFEIIKERSEKENSLKKGEERFLKIKRKLLFEIAKLKRLEKLGTENLDLIKIQIAESVMTVIGDPYAKIENETILDLAIIDIANNCQKLKKEYFGNKQYDRFYQRCNCEYGLGPKHGSIVDMISLNDDYRNVNLSDIEKNACVYYLKNYNKIKK